MKAGIDISQIVFQGTGVATYTKSLVEALLKVDKDDQFVFFGSSLRNISKLGDFLKQLKLEGKNFKKRLYPFPPKLLEILWNGVHLVPVEALTGEIDVFHSSDWLEPPTRSAKRITTIHDFAVYKYPEAFTQRGGHNIVTNQKRKNFFVKHYSDLIIAVSETTKKDAIEMLKIPEKKIRVIYEASDPVYFPRKSEAIKIAKEKFGIEGDYFLCVGTREPRKNLDRLIASFIELAKSHSTVSLAIAGKYGWGNDAISGVGKEMKNIKVLGFVESEDLAGLYSGAMGFVYPSLYEGFGLPILDAMACGAPVITSNVGSMKEIAGGAAVLVDPESVESIGDAMEKVLSNSVLRKDLTNKGLKRSAEFSWEKTALQTLEAYYSLLA